MIIGLADPSDPGQILTVQLAAHGHGGAALRRPHIVPLNDTLTDVREAIDAGQVLVARRPRGVGAVRGVVDGQVGTVERVGRFVLFTGRRSESNLRLHRKAGYVDTHTVWSPTP